MKTTEKHTCPAHSAHGEMVLRPLTHQTPEQKWCGVWYDCTRCTSSVLIPSAEIQADLERQKQLAAQPQQGTLFAPTSA